MSAQDEVKIIAFVGLAGSGKSTAVEFFASLQLPRVYFGGIVLEELRRRGLEPTQANEKLVREAVRQEEGKDFVVKRAMVQIDELLASNIKVVVADGLYTWTEYKILRHKYANNLFVVAILTSRNLRTKRLINRPFRPINPEEMVQRDEAEIENLEKGGPIAMADYFIINDGSLKKYARQLSALSGQFEL